MAKGRSAVLVASLIWGGSIFLSRIIGLIREAVIGRVLGGGQEASVYLTAFILPDFLNYLLAGGALSLVFIPLFNQRLSAGEPERGWAAFSAISTFLALLLAVFTTLLWVLTPQITPFIAPGFGEAELITLNRLVRIMLPAQIFHVLGGLLSATLQARDRHALPALAPLLYTGCIIAGGLVGGGTLGAEGFAWGVLVGSVLGPFALPLVGNLQAGIRWRPSLDWRNEDFQVYLLRSLPIMLGFSVVIVDDWILRQQGSLVSESAVATLVYAKNLMKVPMGVFGLAVGAATFPTLTRLLGQGQRSEGYQLLASATKRMLVLAFAAQVAMTAAGPEIARIIYGARLEPGQPEAIGLALGVMGVGLWAWAAQTVIARGFYAEGRTWVPTVAGSIVIAVCYPLYLALRASWGEAGLALASTVAITVYVVALVLLLRHRFAGEADGFGRYFVRMVPATGLGIAAGVGLRYALPPLPPLLGGAIFAMVAGLVFAGAAWALRVEEAREVAGLVLGRVQRRIRRPRRG